MKIEDSADEMYSFLSIYYLTHKDYKKPSKSSKLEYLNNEISKLIDTRLKEVIKIIDNPYYETLLLVFKGIDAGYFVYKHGSFYTAADDLMYGKSFIDVAKFLVEERNSEKRIHLEAYLNSKDE